MAPHTFFGLSLLTFRLAHSAGCWKKIGWKIKKDKRNTNLTLGMISTLALILVSGTIAIAIYLQASYDTISKKKTLPASCAGLGNAFYCLGHAMSPIAGNAASRAQPVGLRKQTK